MRYLSILWSVALMAPTLSVAQPGPVPEWPIAAGSRVRILSPVLGDQKQTGSVVSSTPDTLVFRSARQSTATAIGTPNIVRIDVGQGTHSSKLKGALLGLVIGAGSGAAIGYATYKRPTCQSFCLDIWGRGGDTAVGAVLGGAFGTLAGAIVGSRQTDTWVPVAVPIR